MFTQFLTAVYWEVLPALLEIVSVLVGIVLIRISLVLKERWGIEIEARHREALHSAIDSGIQMAIGRGLIGKDAVSAAISHAAKSVPDALARLDPAMTVLNNIAEAKLGKILAGTKASSAAP